MDGLTNRSRKWIGVVALVVALAALAGCASWFSSSGSGTPIEVKPVITGSISASVLQPAPGETTTFTVNASDPQGDALTYAWDDGNATDGTFSKVSSSELTTDTGKVNWMADNPGTFTITVIVSDPSGNTAEGSTQVTVTSGNQPPVISAFTVNNATPAPDEDVTLTVTASDPDGDTLTYTWDDGSGGGTFSGTGASVTYSNSTEGDYTITVTVSDGELSDSATVDVSVQAEVIPNNAPVFEDDTVDPPVPYTLVGDVTAPVATQRIRYFGIKATDPDGDTVTYEWTADGDGEFTDITVDADGFAEAYWAADNPGTYVVTLTADDGKGGTSMVSATASIATDSFDVTDLPTEFDYVGYEGCVCHPDKQTEWQTTNHAHAQENAGILDPTNAHAFRSEHCYACHAVGYEPVGEGGFIDNELTPQFANIQCESCHGGGNPPGMGSDPPHKPTPWDPSIGLLRDGDGNLVMDGIAYVHDPDYDGSNGYGCGLCHEGTRHGAFEEWVVSHHNYALFEDDGVTPVHQATNTGCVMCHNGYFFVDIQIDGNDPPAENMDETTFNADSAMIGCATCHDPHDAQYDHQLRVDGNADAIIPFDDTNIGPHGAANTCIKCHNGRRTRDDYNTQMTSGSGHFGPHHNVQGPMLFGVMGADLDGPTTYASDHPHKTLTDDACIQCHMYQRDFISNDEPKLWGHTWEPMVEACAECHVGETDMDALRADLIAEVQGLLDDFVAAWPADWKDVSDPSNPVLYNEPVVTDPPDPGDHDGPPLDDPGFGNDYRACLWNYYVVVDDGSMGTHNPTFAEDLLNKAIARLGELNAAAGPSPNP